MDDLYTLLETNISLYQGLLKIIFLFTRWDMLVPWRVYHISGHPKWWFSETRRSPVASLGTEEGGSGGKEKKVS